MNATGSTILPGQFPVTPEAADGPAVATPPVTVPSSEKILAKIKEKVKGLSGVKSVNNPPSTAKPASPDPAKVDGEDGQERACLAPEQHRDLFPDDAHRLRVDLEHTGVADRRDLDRIGTEGHRLVGSRGGERRRRLRGRLAGHRGERTPRRTRSQ